MRVDKRLEGFALTTEQRFFASCWFNMVHEYSLDSYRVRAMNPRNGLKELARMMSPHASNNDLYMVADELQELLKSDSVLQAPPFKEPLDELLDLLTFDKNNRKKKYESNQSLLLSYTRELSNLVKLNYIEAALQLLERVLISDVESIEEEKRYDYIHALVGSLLSILLDLGASIESLFQLYVQVIRSLKYKKNYDFEKMWGVLKRIINQEPRKFYVIFTVDNISNINDFPRQIGAIKFTQEPPVCKNPKPAVERYLKKMNKRLFAQIEVETKDYRTAGTDAYEIINNILDLVRFEYEPERLQLPEGFAITAVSSPNAYRMFPIPKVVPNPTVAVDCDGLEGFIESVNELMLDPSFAGEGRNRIQSAFRLYRIGSDTNIFESKLVNWWTAIEYLVKGSNGTGGIGDAVERQLVPVLCAGYVSKLLLSFRNAIVDMKAQLIDQTTGNEILLKELNLTDLYLVFKDPLQASHIVDSIDDPFFKYKLQYFLEALSEPKKLAALITGHEKRLGWHVQRLYRARCDIVHSAEQIVNAALLCANLEFYLKSALTALLREIRPPSHILDTREFFDRQSHTYRKLVAGLKEGSDACLRRSLQM